MENSKKTIRNLIILLLVCLIVMGGAFYFSRTYLVVYPVKGMSMEPTINDSDFVLLFRTQKVKHDDVIVFYCPEYDKDFVKRVIGLENDQIDIKYSPEDDNYHVYRNGELIPEGNIKEPMKYNGEISVKVPAGKVFFLGDNRMDSIDSHVGLLADIEEIKGVAFVKYKGWNINFL